MSITTVSNLSVRDSLTTALQSEQARLSTLTTQLSSGVKYDDLTDYTSSEARNYVNLQAAASQKQSYVKIISSVNNTLSIYDTTLTDLEEIVTQAKTLGNNNPTYNEDVALNVRTQAESYLKSVTVDLNQSINGRYVYSGSRYTTPPVQDLSELPESTLTSTLTTGYEVPSYDTEYVALGGVTSEASYTTDNAPIDTNYRIDYGITSNDPAFQKMIAGLRYLQAAGNSTDTATYSTNMTEAVSLLTEALSAIQLMHTTVASNMNIVDSEKSSQETAISNFADQIADIQQVDTTQVSTEITALETTLQASYTVTGDLLKMSLINYL